MYHIFCIHSSINEHLHCCHILTVVNNEHLKNIFHLLFHLMYYFKCERTVSSIFTSEQPNIQKDEDLSQVTSVVVEQDLNPVLSGSKAHASPQPEVNTD